MQMNGKLHVFPRAHHRPRRKVGSQPNRSLLMRKSETPMWSVGNEIILLEDGENGLGQIVHKRLAPTTSSTTGRRAVLHSRLVWGVAYLTKQRVRQRRLISPPDSLGGDSLTSLTFMFVGLPSLHVAKEGSDTFNRYGNNDRDYNFLISHTHPPFKDENGVVEETR